MPPFVTDNRSPILKKLVGIVSGVGASQTAVIKIPPGATYTDLLLQCTIAGTGATRAQFESMFTSMRLTVSGVEKWTLTAKQLIAIIEFYSTGLIGDSGIITIPFERLWMDGQLSQTAPNYGTAGESSMQLEITQSAGSTIDLIEVWGSIDPVAEPLGAHVKMLRLTPNIGATGTFIFPDLYKKAGDFLYALHFEVPVVANLTNIAYVADEVRLIDASPTVINRLYLRSKSPRTVQSAKLFVHLDFASRCFDSDAIPLTMNTQILELTFANAAPNQVNIIAEIGTRAPNQAGVAA